MLSFIKKTVIQLVSLLGRYTIPIYEGHTYIVGMTGSGKSTILRYIIYKLLRRKNKSITILIDPHATLARSIPRLPLSKEEQAKIILFDPELIKSEQCFPCINPFDIPIELRTDEDFIETLSNELVEAFKGLVSEAGLSLHMKTLLEPIIATLLRKGGTDLRDVKHFLQGDEQHLKQGMQSPNPEHSEFFKSNFNNTEYKKTKHALVSRLQHLLNRPSFVRLCCGRSTMNLNELLQMDTKTILFALSRTDLGKEGAIVLNRLLLSQITIFVWRNGRLKYPKKIHLMIDEFHTITSSSSLLASLLSESRKMGLQLWLSHQHYGQLTNAELSESVLSNTQNKIIGKGSKQTNRILAGETGTPLELLQNLKKHWFILKTQDHTPLSISIPKRFTKKSIASKSYQDWKKRQKRYYKHTDTPIHTVHDETPMSSSYQRQGKIGRPKFPL